MRKFNLRLELQKQEVTMGLLVRKQADQTVESKRKSTWIQVLIDLIQDWQPSLRSYQVPKTNLIVSLILIFVVVIVSK